MPGLIRGVARTAVIAGTATAVSNRVSRRQANRWSNQQAEYQEPEQQAPAYQQPAGTDYDTKLSQLKELGELHNAGVLNDAEFEMQKSKILNS